MATIYERKNSDGSISYRIQIRRKGLKSFSASFLTKEDAQNFVKENESKYCFDKEFTFDRLRNRQEQEFKRKYGSIS